MTYVRIKKESYMTCNRCGGLTKEMFCTIEGGKHLCGECFDPTSDTEAIYAVILDGEMVQDMVSFIRRGRRYTAWYVFGEELSTGGRKRWMCDRQIAWDCDNIGRPVFKSGNHISDVLRLRKEGKKCIMTAISVPELKSASDEAINRYLSTADTGLVFLMDCRDPQTVRCYNRADTIGEMPVVIA